MNYITLHTRHTTYQMGIEEHGFLLHLYYGAKTQAQMGNLLTYGFRCGHGTPYDCKENLEFSCDFAPQEYSCQGSGDYRNQAFRVRTEEGIAGCDLRYREHKIIDGKYSIDGLPASYGEDQVQTLEVILEDTRVGIEVILRYGVFYEEDVITRAVEVKNRGDQVVYLNKVMSASFDFLSGEYDLLHFHGRHFNEMNLERTHVGHELITIGNRRGFSGHQQNAFAILAEKDAGEEHGSCYGMSLMYSGNFKLEAEQDQYNQTRIQMGISDELLDYRLAQGESFAAPEVLMVYSDAGLTTLSHRYHYFIRHHVCRGPYKTKRRPILVNNWEATYFDFTGEKLLEIGRVAKDLGIEMFVLDDGWFGARDLDDKGLGDWVVNEEKMGGPLSCVVNEMNDMGLQFGLWIEPEMVNENSDLYRTHPEWAFQIPGKKPVLGRGQLVLDYTRKEVVDGILDQICKVIDSANISYIKMDMNRSLCDLYSYGSDTQNFGTLMYRYVKGVYYFLDQLLTRYPELLIEGCASGGARFDAGMMYYTPQIWTSDNSDAIERLNIQYGASFGYPVSVVGSHVSAVPNHQNGRITKLQTRGVVAMSGNFGYELDLTKLTEEEKEEIKEQIAVFKENWELIHNGTYYRATTKEEQSEYVAWNMVSEDKEKALLNVVTTNTHGNKLPIYAKCKGLQKDALYVCEETKEVYAGQVLATIGMPILMLDTTFGTPLPLVDGEYNAFQFHFTMQK